MYMQALHCPRASFPTEQRAHGKRLEECQKAAARSNLSLFECSFIKIWYKYISNGVACPAHCG